MSGLLGLCLALVPLGANPAGAQVTLDGSLPSHLEIDGSTIKTIPFDGLSETYTLGDDLGQYSAGGENLFHSLSELVVGDGQTFRIESAQSPSRVITRATGGSGTYFGGTVEAVFSSLTGEQLAGVDYYHLDPSGVTFGQNARLNVGGSIFIATADSLEFDGGARFAATPTALPAPLLLATAPQSFGFLGSGRESIVFDSPEIQLASLGTERLVVVGGDVVVRGRAVSRTPTIDLPGGEVTMVAVGDAHASVPVDGASFDLASADGTLGSVVLEERAIVRVSGTADRASGRFSIRGERFSALAVGDGVRVDAFGVSERANPTLGIDVDVTGDVQLSAARLTVGTRADTADGPAIRIRGGSIVAENGAAFFTDTSGEADAGAITLEAETLRLDTGTTISSTTASSGTSGAVALVATDLLEIDGGSSVRVGARSSGTGRPGEIRVAAREVTMQSGARLESANSAGEAAAPILFEDLERLSLDSGAGIESFALAGGEGAAIEIAADQIDLRGDARILSQTDAGARGGLIDLRSTSGTLDLDLAGSAKIQSGVSALATGRGGDIVIDAGASGTLRVDGGSGLAGPAQIVSQTAGVGDGGNVTLSAERLDLVDGGQVRTTTVGAGNAGTMDIDLTGLLVATGASEFGGEVAPSGLFARSGEAMATTATGDGGLIDLAAMAIELRDGAEISSRTFGAGSAGALVIDAQEHLLVEGGDMRGSTISVREIQGSGSALSITADRVTLTNGGVVTATTVGSGNAGTVTVDAREVDVRGINSEGEISGFFASTRSGAADAGNAGGLDLDVSERLLVSDGGRLEVSSEGSGGAGDLSIRGGGLVRVSEAGELRATVRDTRAGIGASSILVSDASAFELATNGSVSVETTGGGVGGRIEIGARDIELSGNGRISASSRSTGPSAGDAGNIRLAATRDLSLDFARVDTLAESAAGGSIELAAGQNIVLSDASITTSVRGLGADQSAGNIRIEGLGAQLPRFVATTVSTVRADAVVATAGNISIAAQTYLASATAEITANSELGIDGVIAINAPDTNISAEVAALPSAVVDVSALLRDRCSARSAKTGTFLVELREQVTERPDDQFQLPLNAEGASPGASGAQDDPWACPRSTRDRLGNQEDEA